VQSSDLSGSPHTPFPEGRLEFAYNSINHRMYCRTNDGGVYIYAGTSFVRALGTQGFGGGFAWNERDNRMYAACDKDSRIAVIRDVGGGIEEGPVLLSGGHKPLTTIIRGMLFLSEVSRSKPQVASLLDVSGRKVLSLRPAVNDVRALAPGVYFVRQESGAERGSSSVTKIIVTR